MYFFVFLLCLLGFRFLEYLHRGEQYIIGQKVSLDITLSQEPLFDSRQRITLQDGFFSPLILTFPRYPEYHYGDKLHVSGTITGFTPKKISSKSNRLLVSEKVVKSIYFPKVEPGKNATSLIGSKLAFITQLRQRLIYFFSTSLPYEYSGLMLGIVFGIKDSLPNSFSNELRSVGLVHVIAASGMNVTMVALFFSFLCGHFLKRQKALIVSIIGILFYVVLAGFQASILRAAIMGIVLFVGQIFGRQTMPVYVLFLAGVGMLLYSPLLLFDIGFQLSFLSVLGLFYIPSLLVRNKHIKVFVEKGVIGEDIITTVSAQLATIPVLLAYFGSYTIWSVIVNGLVLWTIPILMVLGGVAAFVGLFSEILGKLVLYLAIPFLVYFRLLTHFFAHFPGSISFSVFPWQFIVGYYLILIAVVWWVKKDV